VIGKEATGMQDAPDDVLTGIGVLDADLVAPSLIHELRQPLTGADAAALLLERSHGGFLARDEQWQLLRAQLARLGEIVAEYEDLLGPGDLEPERYAVGPVVSRAVALLAHRVRPLERRFALEGGDGVREGFGAPGSLVHAATNLVANALDAVEGLRGDPRVRVRVLAAPCGGGAEVRVSDEGVGIPGALRSRLFEPRFTTKAPGRGNGLGLHLARRLMARHGGGVFLVPDADPVRLPWAVTEFCIAVPAPPGGGAA
jgi:signal transduction histidine kinase